MEFPPQGQPVGRGLQVGWLPGLSSEEFEELAARVPCPPPTVLRQARGINFLTLGDRPACRAHGPVSEVNLAGVEGGQVLDEDLFPQGLPIAVDPFGNSWTLDLESGGGWGPVFFVCHDPPWVVYQAHDAAQFLRQAAAGQLESGVQRELPLAQPGDDPVLQGFARELGDGWELVDLRAPQPGDAFTWGAYGPQTLLRRCPHARIFARQRPAPQPRSWWGRVLDRFTGSGGPASGPD